MPDTLNVEPRDDRAAPLLRVEGLQKHFAFTKGILFARTLGHVKAVDDVSFEIRAGQTLGLVGESGCGKTTTSRMILNLETPSEGQVLLAGEPIHTLRGERKRRQEQAAGRQRHLRSWADRPAAAEVAGRRRIAPRTARQRPAELQRPN